MRLFHYLSGMVVAELSTNSPERFINICNSRHIPIYDISTIVTKKGTVTVARLRLSDYKNIRAIAKKSHCIPYIRKRLGLPFLLQRYKGRVVFFIGGLYAAWFMWLLSCFVFDIRVSGGFLHTEDEILSYLASKNIVCGIRRSDIDCGQLERQIRLDFPDIGWVSAELVGSKLNLMLSETNQPMFHDTTSGPVHLIAGADGIVDRIIVRHGTPKVRVGDVVKKGDILVSGVIDVIGDNETLVNRYAVAAEADIMLRTVKDYRFSSSIITEVRHYEHKQKNGYALFLGKRKIFSYYPSHSEHNYDIITREFVPSLLQKFPLLFRLNRTTVREYTVSHKRLSDEEQLELVDRALKRYTDYLASHQTKVIETRLSTKLQNDTITSEGSLVLLSAAYERLPVTDEEWRTELPNEYNGKNPGDTGGT